MCGRAAPPIAVVGVDEIDIDSAGRPAQHDRRDVARRELLGQGIVAVQAHEDDPVDVSRGEIADRPLLVVHVVRHEQDELEVPDG